MHVQVNVLSEVAILEHLQGQPRVARLYDYGVDEDHCYMVLKRYPCSLKEWRSRQPADCRQQIRLYLHIFLQVVTAVQVRCLFCTHS